MIENYEQSQKRLRILDRYCDWVRESRTVQSFIWEGSAVDTGDGEHYRPEMMDPKWRKMILSKVKRAGFLVKESSEGFSIEMPQSS